GNPADFKYGFLAAGIGMVIGLIIFSIFKSKHLVTPDGEPVGTQPKKLSVEEKEKLKNQPLSKIDRERIAVIFILSFFVIFFWAAFEQAGVSLTFFAAQKTDRYLSWYDWDIPASFFQSINAVAIVVFAPLFAVLWTKLGSRNAEPASPTKMAMGLFL